MHHLSGRKSYELIRAMWSIYYFTRLTTIINGFGECKCRCGQQ